MHHVVELMGVENERCENWIFAQGARKKNAESAVKEIFPEKVSSIAKPISRPSPRARAGCGVYDFVHCARNIPCY